MWVDDMVIVSASNRRYWWKKV